MSEYSRSGKTYTDSPDLHPNLFLGSVQILFWLFFHPSAWRCYLHRIAPDLKANFTLSQLSKSQRRQPALRRLLLMGYLIYPITVGLLIALTLWSIGESGENIVSHILIAMGYSLIGGWAVGMTVNAGSGMVYGLMIGFGTGLVPVFPEINGILLGVSYGLVSSITGSVAATLSQHTRDYSLVKQVGGLIVGLIVGILAVGAWVAVMFFSVADLARIDEAAGIADSLRAGLSIGTVTGILYGLMVWGRTKIPRRGVIIGLIVALIIGAVITIAFGVDHKVSVWLMAGIGGGMFFAALFGLPFILTEYFAGPWAGAVVGALLGGLAWIPLGPAFFAIPMPLMPTVPLSLIVIFGGLSFFWWRSAPLYLLQAAWNTILYYRDYRNPDTQSSWLRYHSAFWDEYQRLPLTGLDQHLILVAKRHPAETRAAMAYLSAGRQRWAAQSAQIELDARRLEQCQDVETIRIIHQSLGAAGELEGAVGILLRKFNRFSQDVDAALRQESVFNQRLAFIAVENRLRNFYSELTRSNAQYNKRFQPIVTQWEKIVSDYIQKLIKAAELKQEIDNPYIFGIPLTERQEIFIGRQEIAARIEQLLLDQRRPPLLMYGQRRMGKTSLLHNLKRLLPGNIIPLFVDGQGIAAGAGDYAILLYRIAREMTKSAAQNHLALPPLRHETLAADPFTLFDEWLDEVEQAMDAQDKNIAILALDEFENIDEVLKQEQFNELDFMRMLRHLIQHRPRFKVLLAGSHSLEEFRHWASHLINVQTIKIGYLTEEEARQLVERPVQNFALRYVPAACQRILSLTRRHPYLIQLLCYEIVTLKNTQPPGQRRLATLDNVETAALEVLKTGSFFFLDITQNQIDAAGLSLLRFIAAYGEGAIVAQNALPRRSTDELERNLSLLLQRDLIESCEGGYRFQVELIRRWFMTNNHSRSFLRSQVYTRL